MESGKKSRKLEKQMDLQVPMSNSRYTKASLWETMLSKMRESFTLT